MKPSLKLSLLVLFLLSGLPTMAQLSSKPDTKAKQSTKAELTMFQNDARTTPQDYDRLEASVVQLIESVIGEIAKAKVKVCFAAGYPGNPHPEQNGLSRREVAECDGILEKLDKHDARLAAEKARKDADYDKSHPVEK